MRTLLWIVMVLSSGMALADSGRVAPPLEVINENGPSPLHGSFLSHASQSPRTISLIAPKNDVELIKPPALPIIGRGRATEISTLTPGERAFGWRDTDDGFVAELSVRSIGAAAIRVALGSDSFEGMEIRVGDAFAWSGTGSAQVLDSELVKALRKGAVGPLWTPITSGEVQIVQLLVRSELRPGPVWLENISHMDVDPHVQADQMRARAKLLACEQNYSCSSSPTIQAAGKAVAKIAYTTSAGSTFLCSGALLNDKGSTGTPWFATAFLSHTDHFRNTRRRSAV